MELEIILVSAIVAFIWGLLFGTKGVLILAAVYTLGTLIVMDHDEHAEANHDRTVYCKMVEAWHQDAKLGIAPEDRGGWPPFDGECND